MPLATGSDPFIGRAHEMAELVAALEGAVEGRGGLIMLAGEPGIGKTRLAEELESAARDRGALTTTGACYEGALAGKIRVPIHNRHAPIIYFIRRLL